MDFSTGSEVSSDDVTSTATGSKAVHAPKFDVKTDAKRDELLKDCQRIIAKDAVNGFLYQLAKIGVWKKELMGMWENAPTPSDYLAVVYWKA